MINLAKKFGGVKIINDFNHLLPLPQKIKNFSKKSEIEIKFRKTKKGLL